VPFALDLSSTGVTDAGLKKMAHLTNLTTLTLVDTEVTDAGLEHPAALKSLTDLNLRNSKVTAEGVTDLQKALPNCKITR